METAETEMSKEKQHSFIKTISIIVSIGLAFGIDALSMLIVKDEGSFKQIMLGNLIEIVILGGVLLLWAKVMPRIFPGTDDFRFRKLTAYQVMMAAGISLLSLMAVYRLLYLLRGGAAHVTMVPVIYNQSEFMEDMMASIHAILIAPVIEETCFRLIPASVIRTGKNRIVMLTVLTIVFAFMHPKNMLAVLMDASVFCVLLLATKNPLVPILCHVFNNFLKTASIALAYYNVIEISMAEGGGTIILFSIPVTLVSAAIAAVLILPSVIKLICRNKS